eukprot:GILK01021333.1.p1 GENE.GILK01021333.1~~GILK01021333.1.p1  ORF type:complete len:535 (+),score=35.37 GILK01021333.1:1-1605(+)
MDIDGNKRLSAEEVKLGFAACGLELTTSELRRLMAAVDRNGNGAIELNEFLRIVRGPLPRARVKVVEDAWKKIDPQGAGVASTSYVLDRYCAKDHPAVTRGDRTEEAVYGEFASAFQSSETVTKEEFLDYYTGVSDSIDHHEYFDLCVRNVWRLDQPKDFGRTGADHHGYTVNQFQSSAYRGCDGSFPAPDAEDKVGAKREPRFASMISNNLVPFPIHKLGGCPTNAGAGVYLGSLNSSHKINTANIAEKCPDVTLDFNKSSTGQVPLMATSRGFITDTTSTATMHGEFSDDVMDTFIKGKERERAIEAERKALQATPFGGSDPHHWARSSDAYADYRKVDRSAFTATNAVPVLSQAAANRTKTSKMMEAGRNVDMAALQSQYNTTNAKSLPRGFSPNSQTGLTTMKDHFAGYDPAQAEASNDRWASVPLQHRHQVATQEEKHAYEAQKQRFATRHEGNFNTEKADKHCPVFDDAEINHSNDIKGAFSIRDGVRCLSEKVHKPRDAKTGLTMTRSDIVPGQHVSMSTKPLHTPN